MIRTNSGEIIGVLDIGSSKICCVIAQRSGPVSGNRDHERHGWSMIGLGQHRSRGLKSGVIVDLDEAERSVRAAVAQAEGAAGLQLKSYYVNVSCGRLKSLTFSASAGLANGTVGVTDMANLWDGAREYAARSGHHLISLNEIDYRLDGSGGIVDPRGLAGRELVADIHAVVADVPPIRNLQALLRRSYLEASDVVPSGLASALAATTPEERMTGVTCIDIGGGTMTTAVFVKNRFVHTDLIAYGGNNITVDIATRLAISFDEAERLKTLYGSLLPLGSDDTDLVGYNAGLPGQIVRQQAPRGQIRELVHRRVVLLLHLLGEKLNDPGIRGFGRHRLVLTGGSSQILGLTDVAGSFFGRPVRIGSPIVNFHGAASLKEPSFSCVVGLVEAAHRANHLLSARIGGDCATSVSWDQVGRWIRDSF